MERKAPRRPGCALGPGTGLSAGGLLAGSCQKARGGGGGGCHVLRIPPTSVKKP